jgi:deoxycytidylate deaminase
VPYCVPSIWQTNVIKLGAKSESVNTSIPQIIYPELFIAFVAPVGAETSSTISAFKQYFSRNDYNVVEIKVTDIFNVFEKYITPKRPLVRAVGFERYTTFIEYGDQLREYFSDDAILAAATVGRILKKRTRLKATNPFEKTVYLLHQFKRKEEINLFRSIYGRLFFQVSIYSRRGARVDALSRIFSHSDFLSNSQNYRDRAENIIKTDENETSNKHGQRVAQIFHDADLIVNSDNETPVSEQIDRFCELLFGSNKISPTRYEYGMYLAKAAALRTLDLSRQVGAAIFSTSGEVLSLGSNEVPRAGGGTYWGDERFDDRDYMRGEDPNAKRKEGNLRELFKNVGMNQVEIEKLIASEAVQESQVMDALEYGRVVHAEMSALADAARLGISVQDATLYCTTFPCHMCAKHLVAAGLSKIVFLEHMQKVWR